MRASQLVATVVVAATVLTGLGALVTFASSVLSSLRLAAVIVVALAVLYVVAASALGSRSRRWRANPYW